jgi:hypothetical protein
MGTNPLQFAEGKVHGEETVQRIGWLTLGIGFAAALGTAVVTQRWRWAAGLTVGTALGWLNFRVLQRGARILLYSSPDRKSDKKPRMAILGAILRYGLIALTAYVSFKYLQTPVVSLMTGLCCFGLATFAASVWAILNPENR